jgi:mRNA interferase MazF
VLAIGLTTTVRQLPTWVPLSSGDPLTGYANADNIETLGKDELGDPWCGVV